MYEKNLNNLILNLFILANLINGIIFEILGIIITLYYFLKEFYQKNLRIKKWKIVVGICLVWFGYFIIQILLLNLNIVHIVRLYGITKSICAPFIVLICFNSLARKKDIMLVILPTFILIIFVGIIDYIFNTRIINFGSLNYIGSMNIIICLYLLKGIEVNKKIFKILPMISMMLITLASGSRSILLSLILLILACVATEEEKKKRRFYFIILFLLSIILILFFLNLGLNYDFDKIRGGNTILSNISRALTVFTSKGRFDQARSDLKERAFNQYKNSMFLKKIIGSGDNVVHIGMKPVHNCFLEILLCYGIIGLILFSLTIFFYFVLVYKNSNDKKYAIIILGIILLFGIVQPFITTGILYQLLIGFISLNCINKNINFKRKGRKK